MQTCKVTLTLPTDVYEILGRRVLVGKHRAISRYLEERIAYDIRRKHGGKAKKAISH